LVKGGRHPDGVLSVGADPVRIAPREGRKDTSSRKRSVRSYIEADETLTISPCNDQRWAPVDKGHAVGEQQVVCTDAYAAAGLNDQEDGAARLHPKVIEPEIADIGAADGVNHHLVTMPRSHITEVAYFD
jgi:hypothetical protein